MLLVAGAATVVACTAAQEPTVQGAMTTTTRPVPDLNPEAGTVRTTVAGVGDDAGALPDDLLLVGDSVLVLVADDLAERIDATLRVDAADCRRIDQAVSGPCGGVPEGATIASGLTAILDAREGERTPPGAAVLVLANNSTITRDHVDAVMEATAGIDQVWWVNARIQGLGRQDLNNQVLAELVETDPRAGLVDWYGASEAQSWLADPVHPNEDGQTALAELIEDRLVCGCPA